MHHWRSKRGYCKTKSGTVLQWWTITIGMIIALFIISWTITIMAITDVWNSPQCERLTTLLQPLLRETQAHLLLSSTGAKAALSEGSGQSGWRQSGRLYWLNFGRSHNNHCPDLNHPRNTRFEFEMTLVLTRMMVTNLHLKPLTCASLRASHHTRVVDQNVNLCISIFRYQSVHINL